MVQGSWQALVIVRGRTRLARLVGHGAPRGEALEYIASPSFYHAAYFLSPKDAAKAFGLQELLI